MGQPAKKFTTEEISLPGQFSPLETEGELSAVHAREVLFLGVLLAFLQLLDGIFTSMGVARWGTSVEGNPFLRTMMEQFGHLPTLALMKCLAIGIICCLTMLAQERPWVKNAMSAVCCVYVVAAIIPWAFILFIRPLFA